MSRLAWRSVVPCTVFAVLSGTALPASAAFFQIAENSGSGLGAAFAGGAALAEDASTVWYNPAGMIRLEGAQFVAAGHLISPSFKAKVNSASAITTSPISGGGGDAGESALVPNLYYTRRISNEFALGAGINAPFGLATEYDSTWAGRYHAIRSEIKTVNFNLSGAYKLTEAVSIGAGLNYQMLDAELTQAIDFATICTLAGAGPSTACGAGGGFNPNTNPLDGSAKVTADSNEWGYNLGLLAQLSADARIGVAYRSRMKHSLSGNFSRTLPVTGIPLTDGTVSAVATGAGIVNSGASANATLPATLSLSIYKEIGSRWALMADYTRTYWSDLPELRIDFSSAQPDSVVTLNLEDADRYALGAMYKPGGAWRFRAGVALDKTPVGNQADNSPRLPDADRTWFTLGASWSASQTMQVDFGYAYITIDDATVRKTATPTNENLSRGNLSVDYDGSVQIFSVQARWLF